MKSSKILIIDDEGTRLILIERILAHKGHRIRRAESSEHAIALLGPETDADIVIAGIEIQGSDAIRLIEITRRSRPTARIWLIMRTLISRPAADSLRKAADKAVWWGDLPAEFGFLLSE